MTRDDEPFPALPPEVGLILRLHPCEAGVLLVALEKYFERLGEMYELIPRPLP